MALPRRVCRPGLPLRVMVSGSVLCVPRGGARGRWCCGLLRAGGCVTATCPSSATACRGTRRPRCLGGRCCALSSLLCGGSCWSRRGRKRTNCRWRSGLWSSPTSRSKGELVGSLLGATLEMDGCTPKPRGQNWVGGWRGRTPIFTHPREPRGCFHPIWNELDFGSTVPLACLIPPDSQRTGQGCVWSSSSLLQGSGDPAEVVSKRWCRRARGWFRHPVLLPFLRPAGHPYLSWNELDSEAGSRPGIDGSLAGGSLRLCTWLPRHTRPLAPCCLNLLDLKRVKTHLNIFKM